MLDTLFLENNSRKYLQPQESLEIFIKLSKITIYRLISLSQRNYSLKTKAGKNTSPINLDNIGRKYQRSPKMLDFLGVRH